MVLSVMMGCTPNPETQPEQDANQVRGHQLYVANCLACHQAEGRGKDEVFPPLQANATVSGPKDRLIRIVMHGLTGPINVRGLRYDSEMQGLSRLADEELAILLTYIRRNWSNQGEPVTREDVTLVRRTYAQRIQPWTMEELDQLSVE